MDNMTKICRHCNKQFNKTPSISLKNWRRRFCCSKECGDKSKQTPWLKKYEIKKGQRLSVATEFKKGQTSHNFKGEKAGYTAKHDWIRRTYGKPNFCEHCKDSSRKTIYQWANISRTHIRSRSDWLRLCVRCHLKYDRTPR